MASPFLDLPGEIRNQILRLLLTHTTRIITRSASQLAPPKPTPLGLSPGVLLASWRTYYEGLSILYGENTFQAHPSYLTSIVFAMEPTLTVAPHHVSMVRRFHIRVRLDCDTYYDSEKVKEVFTGADELEVELFRASWGMGGYDSLDGFVGIRGVRRARVHGSVGPKFARWLEDCMESKEGAEAGVLESDEGYDGRSLDG
ncbi:hypothetical protein P7C71_g2008, partial [Lecanoromycetidae sp. Uapishka_2]